VELNVERKKAQSDDTKKISIDNSHAAAVDTSELVAEMMVCSQLPCVNLAQTKTLSSASISLKPKHYRVRHVPSDKTWRQPSWSQGLASS